MDEGQENERDLETVGRTWKELGHSIRPLRYVILVRTDPLPTKTISGLHLSPKMTNFYGELPHVQLITATVLSSGPKAVLEPGDKVCFQRLFFARYEKMEDGTMVGWIAHEGNVIGLFEGDPIYVQLGANLKRAPQAPPGISKSGSFGGGGSA